MGTSWKDLRAGNLQDAGNAFFGACRGAVATVVERLNSDEVYVKHLAHVAQMTRPDLEPQHVQSWDVGETRPAPTNEFLSRAPWGGTAEITSHLGASQVGYDACRISAIDVLANVECRTAASVLLGVDASTQPTVLSRIIRSYEYDVPIPVLDEFMLRYGPRVWSKTRIVGDNQFFFFFLDSCRRVRIGQTFLTSDDRWGCMSSEFGGWPAKPSGYGSMRFLLRNWSDPRL
jgi:hypothetical protein